jgi:hypothetical protein
MFQRVLAPAYWALQPKRLTLFEMGPNGPKIKVFEQMWQIPRFLKP